MADFNHRERFTGSNVLHFMSNMINSYSLSQLLRDNIENRLSGFWKIFQTNP